MMRSKSSSKAVRCLCILLALLIFLPVTVYGADKYMECRHADFVIVLDEYGGASVTESWECLFGGATISRYRRSYTLKDPAAMSIEVSGILMDGQPMVLLDAPDSSRPEGCAAVWQEDNTTHVEMYLSALDEVHTFEISYYLSGAVLVHNDAAEFYWNLTSSHESFDTAQVTGFIEIPYGTQDHGLYFWGHGPSENARFDAIVEDGMVNRFELYTENVSRDRGVSVRFAMPTELFGEATRFSYEDKLDAILEEEHANTDVPADNPTDNPTDAPADVTPENPDSGNHGQEVDPHGPLDWLDKILYQFHNVIDSILSVWSVISLVLCFAPILMAIFLTGLLNRIAASTYLPKVYGQKRFKPALAPEYYRTLPDELTPGMVYKLMTVYPVRGEGKEIHGNSFSATVLDLVERGLIRMDKNAAGEVTYLLSPDLEQAVLAPYERELIGLYREAGAGTAPLTTTQITRYMRENYSWCKRQYKLFFSTLDESFEKSRLGQHYPSPEWSKSKYITIGIITSFVLLVGLQCWVPVFPSLIVCGVVGFINTKAFKILWDNLHPEYTVLTQDGENRYALWKAYKHFLEDFTTFREREVSDVAVWRKHLVYATALGCSQKVIDNLKITLPEVYSSIVSDPFTPCFRDIEDSVSAIDTEGGYTIRSSSSSSGGGSSSGSDDWGGFSDSGGSSDSGASGSDFD